LSFTTRFAPSPTGPLHLGHAYSALLAYDMAQAAGGEFLLRIEDIDTSRARPEWETQIYDDLAWLGLHWRRPVARQSERKHLYDAALSKLWETNLLFACRCTRRDIAEALSAPQEGAAPALGPDGAIYPGTCRASGKASGEMVLPDDAALRLDMRSAMQVQIKGETLSFTESGVGPEGETGQITFTPQNVIETIGDVVLARRDMGTSYHLSVVLDDAAQGVTHVVRGCDLFDATRIHVILQRLLGLPTPIYHHHRLIRDAQAKRLAKRDDARAIALFRAEGATPQDIRVMVGLSPAAR